ncbi:M20 family peptidase [Salirhabdus sp. Marseille-P4669]|uniref:M20 family peptidase n=1 Tax=Salirhabdus sp. Marseille-P4669 TaxID=2042310 RepID=UPI000C7A0B3E|nr:M20 family peptidase [Salirhabdus sp. Marseille-P4669]
MKKWKLVLLILLSLLLIFIIVTVFNTMRVSSKQPTPEETTILLNEEEAIARFSESLTYKTISYQDRSKFDFAEFDRFIFYLEESYPEVHDQLELEKINEYALVYKWEGSDKNKNPIGLTGHYDVVPVLEGTEENWKQDPFSGAIVDGVIWGRGTLDDKIGVIGILEAVSYLIEQDFQPTRDMYFMFGFDEEIGGEKGAKAIVDTLEDSGITFDFVLDEGGAIVKNMVPGVDHPVGVVGIAEKGSATAELSIEGSGGHSSQPKSSTNIGRIAAAIAKLEETQFDADLQGPGKALFEYVAPEMSFGMKYVFANSFVFEPLIENILLDEPASAALIRTTIAPTIFQAGEQYNALPERASAVINLRLMPGETLESVQEFIEETIADEKINVTVSGSESSKVSSYDTWQFEVIQKAARNVYSDAIIAPYLMFAGSDAKHYDRISENTYRFLPVLLTSEDLERMHGTNEHISVDNYVNAIKVYAEVIMVANE